MAGQKKIGCRLRKQGAIGYIINREQGRIRWPDPDLIIGSKQNDGS